uniref:Non-selective voltage-gated ion channel VDAC2 n=1 Tax=Peromyscus maniculatus bairdii TaxID=230844 RepID=A0A8C8UJF4_PERMB
MYIPPSYVDLSKTARDIFNRGFGFGLVKLDVKTKSCSGVELSTTSSSNTDTGKVTGTLETKYKWCLCEYGLTFTEKWNMDDTVGIETAIEDQTCRWEIQGERQKRERWSEGEASCHQRSSKMAAYR